MFSQILLKLVTKKQLLNEQYTLMFLYYALIKHNQVNSLITKIYE